MNVRQWTEGVLDDGAVILCDGERVTISDVLARLNHAEHIEAERDTLRARIGRAPSRVVDHDSFVSAVMPLSYAGKHVALVVLGDDE